jgi:cytochrome P450
VVKVTFRDQNAVAHPGPRPGVFPLGAAITLADLARDPHPLLARLRGAEPVSWLPALHGWLVTRHDLAVAVMRDSAAFTVDDPRFSTARVVGPSMLSLDGTAHGRHRAPFTKGFGRGEIHARLAGFVQAETDRLVAAVRPGGAADVRRSLAGPLAVAVVAETLGLGDADPATVLGWYAAIVAAVSALTGAQGAPNGDAQREHAIAAGADAFGALSARLTTVIGSPDGSLVAAAAGARHTGAAGPRHTGQARPGVGGAAAGVQDTEGGAGTAGGGLTTAEVISNAAVIMFGGIETTEGMISNVILHLLSDPGQFALVRGNPDLVPNAVEESLRLEPAAAVVDRYATRDVTLGGARIRSGDLVTVSLAGAGRDPAVFQDPGRFDVRRPNSRLNLAFAHGPHFCLGAHLARLEAQAAVRAMLTLPRLRLDPVHPAAPRGLVFRKPPSLRVLWDA